MLIKIINWLSGYVIFTFTGGFADGFINRCYQEKINIKNMVRDKKGLSARCSIKAYKRLHTIALRSGGRVRIIKKKGLPFITHPLRGRWGIFAGALFFVLFTSFMGGFIWNITVIGNDTLQASKIVDYLAQNGFKTGVRWSDTDKENLEFAVMADFDEVSWISINRFGCLAQIEIRETVNKPDIVDNNKITNVRAAKDGVIVEVTALGGWSAVKPGEAVTKGDLLISGIYEADETQNPQQNHYAHAHGTVIAQTSYEITVNIPREQSEKVFTSQREYKTLYFFGLKIPLYFKKEDQNAVAESGREYLVLNDFRLPIGIYTDKYSYYSRQKRRADDAELEALAQAELEKKEAAELAGCEIIGRSSELDINESGCTLTVSYSLFEDIGEEAEITFSQSESNNP